MKKKALSWLNYVSIGIVAQSFLVAHMCNVRGSIEIGGEYLILPAMIMARIVLEDFFGEKDYGKRSSKTDGRMHQKPRR